MRFLKVEQRVFGADDVVSTVSQKGEDLNANTGKLKGFQLSGLSDNQPGTGYGKNGNDEKNDMRWGTRDNKGGFINGAC